MRALEKTHSENGGDYSGLKDLARCSISCADVLAVERCLAHLAQHADVVRVKDRLSALRFDARGAEVPGGYDAALKAGGYRDMLLNVRIDVGGGDGHVAEVQIHLAPFLDIKQHQGGHACYEMSRSLRASDVDVWKVQGEPAQRDLDRVRDGVTLQLSCANAVTDRVPRALCAGANCRLVDVVLSDNRLGVSLADLLGAAPICPSLRRLVLNNCDLTGPVDARLLCGLAALQVALLHSNRLEGILDVRAVVEGMPLLAVLRLANNAGVTVDDKDAPLVEKLRERCFVDFDFTPASRMASNRRGATRFDLAASLGRPRGGDAAGGAAKRHKAFDATAPARAVGAVLWPRSDEHASDAAAAPKTDSILSEARDAFESTMQFGCAQSFGVTRGSARAPRGSTRSAHGSTRSARGSTRSTHGSMRSERAMGARRRSSGVVEPARAVGDRVEARSGFRGGAEYYPGTITAARDDGTFDVVYEDGERETSVEAACIRRAAAAPRGAEASGLRVDQRVEARYKGLAKYYAGTIAAARGNGTFDLLYDDGEEETGVRAELVRPLGGDARDAEKGASPSPSPRRTRAASFRAASPGRSDGSDGGGASRGRRARGDDDDDDVPKSDDDDEDDDDGFEEDDDEGTDDEDEFNMTALLL
ncbi:hypothetical protein M885DRAFT_545339 [Pelagophyceae sp. CCMP2097]|nr:hypothetical protein M885DRAFT_545339 [Pelagophyceae sp. CCMP2097]